MAVYVPARSLTARNPSVERGDLVELPLAEAVVDLDEGAVRPHQVSEETDQQASDDRHEESASVRARPVTVAGSSGDFRSAAVGDGAPLP